MERPSALPPNWTQYSRQELDENLEQSFLNQRFVDMKELCRQNPNVCAGDLWLHRAKLEFGTEARDMYGFKDHYYNYLAARVRHLVRDLNIDRNRMAPIPDYDRRVNEIEMMSEEIARYLKENYPYNFVYITKNEELPPRTGRGPLPNNKLAEKLIVITDSSGRKAAAFGTSSVSPYLLEILHYPDGNIDKLPSLFQEFLKRMGLTYRAAGLLYNVDFSGIPNKGDWI